MLKIIKSKKENKKFVVWCCVEKIFVDEDEERRKEGKSEDYIHFGGLALVRVSEK